MKKIISACTALVLVLSLSACGGPAAPKEEDTRPLSEIMAAILADVPDVPASFETALTTENFAYNLFIDPIEGAEGLAADAMINTIPHTVCLLRVPEGVDAAATAAAIEENADPRKWICVEAEKVIVRQKGQLILLVMSAEATADAIAANFDKPAA